MDELLAQAAGYAAEFRASLDGRPVAPPADITAARARFAGPLADGPTDPAAVIDELVSLAEPALMATAGPRFFGFVIGGALPAATAAEVLTVGWDQVAFNATLSPAGVAAEEQAGGWVRELLGLPAGASVGLVTGAQAANTAGLAAARHHVLAEAG
jgi:glutamate/tyrosine decarboxylase-like PLP-dependent enzyme